MTLIGELEALVEPSLEKNFTVIPAANSNEGENELRWCSSVVTWNVGGIQKRKWTFKSQKQSVLAACFAWFDIRYAKLSRNWRTSGNPALRTSRSTFGPFTLLHEGQAPDSQERTLGSCTPTLSIFICLRDVGHIFTHDGLEFIVNLPFAVEKIWPLSPVGLILKASLPSNTTVTAIGQPSPPFPSPYFTLVTPHDELRPVILGPALPPLDGPTPHHPAPSRNPSLDTSETIIHVSSHAEVQSQGSPSFIIAINRIQRRLRIFYYQLHSAYSEDDDRDTDCSPRPSPAIRTHAGTDSAPPLSSLNRAENPNVLRSYGSLNETLERLAGDSNNNNADPADSLLTGARAAPPTKRGVDSKRNLILYEIWGMPLTETDILDSHNIQISLFNCLPHRCSIGFILREPEPSLRIIQLSQADGTVQLITQDAVPAISIAGVQATRCAEGIKDLLVLRGDGSLFLVTPGGSIEMVIDYALFGSSSAKDALCAGHVVPRRNGVRNPQDSTLLLPSKLANAVGPLVSVIFSDGAALRVTTDLSPRSLLVRSAFVVMSRLCSSALMFDIRRRYLDLFWERGGCDTHEEFQCLSNALLSALEFHPVEGYGSSDGWLQMARHSIHRRLINDQALRSLWLPQESQAMSPMVRQHPEIPQVLHSLHLLGEELKVDGLRRHELSTLAPLLIQLAYSVGTDWVEYWLRTCPDVVGDWRLSDYTHIVSPLNPPDISTFLHTSLGVLSSSQFYVGVELARDVYRAVPSYEYGPLDALPMTTSLLAIYAALKDAADLSPSSTRERAHKTVLEMLERGVSLSDINRFPLSIASPLLEAIRTTQNSPPSDWPPNAYLLIGRNDLAKMALGDSEELPLIGDGYLQKLPNMRPQASYETIDVISEHSRVLSSLRMGVTAETDPTKANFSIVRFAEDQRLAEVDMILDSSRIPNVKVPERPDLNEHDLAKELAVTVNHIVERTFAEPFGRAIYTFGSVMRLTRDEYFVPPVEMQVKFVPHNVTYPPDMTKILPEAKQWAEFHNGVAASLRLNPRAEGIDSSWIAFNKPQELSAEHAGYLLGLGLTGHLRSMWNWHGYRYLLPKHELTSIAILLGLGASHVGSSDPEVTRLITIHMRPLLPPDSADLGIPLGAQSAALMGLGLLYLGTGNPTMADVAMRELSVAHLIGGPEISNEHREAYTLTAGLSYGLIMCGLGSSTTGSSDDSHLTELRAFVAGKESPVASTIFSAHHPTARSVNLNYVSPAATIALALTFLKTNRSDIASSFALPPDPAGLKDVQPGLLLLRALGRSLIMWDDITPTVAWVLGQAQRTPKDLSKKQLQEGVRELYEFAFFNILSGACLAIGLKYAGQATAAANHVLIHFHDKLLENLRRQPPGQSFEVQLRRAAIRETINIVDLALGLVMAGSGDVACLQRLRVRHGLFGPHIKYGAHIATHMALGFLFLAGGRYTLGTSNAAIACLLIALFPRFPLHSNDTRGLLQAFRHLWVLSVEPRCLIARDADTNEITRIPIKIKVNEPSGEPVRTHHFICPTLLPDFGRFISIKIDSPRYWPFVLNVVEDSRARNTLLRTQTIHVKRRTGYLSYADDPTGYQSISVWNGTPVGDPALLDFPLRQTRETYSSHNTPDLPRSFHDMRHFTRSSTNDAYLLGFSDRLCRSPGRDSRESATLSYAQQALLEALSGDKQQVLPVLLEVYQTRLRRSEEMSLSGWNARDLHLANEFYAMLFRFHGGLIDNNQRQPLVRVASLQAAVTMLTATARGLRQDPSFMAILDLYGKGKDVGRNIQGAQYANWPQILRRLAFVLQHERVPSSQTLNALKRLAQQLVHATYSSSSSIARVPLPNTQDADWRSICAGLALLVQKTALSLSGPRTIPWSLNSVVHFLELWFSPT